MKPKSILNVACVLIVLCLLAGPAYPWASAGGGTHLYIIKDAYRRLTKTDKINTNNFPSKNSISSYTGMGYTGKWGPDATDFKKYPNKGNPYEVYKWSNHYYNPSANRGAGQGNAPNRAQYWYDVLVNEIKAGRAKREKAARAAAYLAHYVSDVGVPYHVMGNLIRNPSPKQKDWYDPNYKEGYIAPSGDHPKWELKATTYSTIGYYGISSEWERCRTKPRKIASFVKAIAARTQSRLGKWKPVNSNKTEAIRHSMQDVYTVYKVAYEEGTSKLAKPGKKPATRPQPRPRSSSPKVQTHTFGPVGASSYRYPKTFTFNLPRNFTKVEISVGEKRKYAGWYGELKVNGRMAWKMLRFEPGKGGIIKDYLLGREVTESSGRGRYQDVTRLCRAGTNRITYKHNTGGPGITIKVRVHTR